MNITPFNFENHTVRIIEKDGQPRFVAKDVCDVLGISNNRDAVLSLSDKQKDDVGITDTIGRTQYTTTISEGGLYKLIFKSKKDEAIKFQDWVTDEVIPAIRKNGSYSIQKSLPQNYKEAVQALLEQITQTEILEDKIQQDKPKVEFAEQLLDSKDAIDFATAVKAMHLPFGRNILFQKCREKGILDRHNTPYQKYVDLGYFIVIESSYGLSNGDRKITTTTRITTKGQKRLLKTIS